MTAVPEGIKRKGEEKDDLKIKDGTWRLNRAKEKKYFKILKHFSPSTLRKFLIEIYKIEEEIIGDGGEERTKRKE